MTAVARVAAPLVLLGALAAVAAAPQGAQPRRASPAAGTGLHRVGRLDAHAEVRVTLVLRPRAPARMRRLLNGLEDPRSADYHRFAGARTFGARFGPSRIRLRRAASWLRAAGIRTRRVLPQRTVLEGEGSAEAVGRAFRVRFVAYADRRGRTFHAPIGTPRVPSALSRTVTAAAALDTRPRKRAFDVPAGGLAPRDTARAYDISPLYGQGVRGQGQPVAIISFSTYADEDPSAFASRYAIRGPAIERIRLPGGEPDATFQGQGEANLDIDVVRSVAPAARVLFFEVPADASYGDAIDAMVADGRAKIASLSWDECDPDVTAGDRARDERAIDAARAAGITIFVASGDSGAYTCQIGRLGDHRLSAAWPSASAGVVSVGGTRLLVSASGAYAREYAWEDVLSASGGGGGLASTVPRPSWQSHVLGIDNRYSNGRRQLPDVSAAADPDTGFTIYSGGDTRQAGGTSAAAPFWAGAMTLVQQYSRERRAGALGFAAPMLYRLAAAPQAYPPFHDIRRGGNRYYESTPGWDYATGLGSPDVYNLARDVARYLRAGRR